MSIVIYERLTALFPTTEHSALVPHGGGWQGSPALMMVLRLLFENRFRLLLGLCDWNRTEFEVDCLVLLLPESRVGHPSMVLCPGKWLKPGKHLQTAAPPFLT